MSTMSDESDAGYPRPAELIAIERQRALDKLMGAEATPPAIKVVAPPVGFRERLSEKENRRERDDHSDGTDSTMKATTTGGAGTTTNTRYHSSSKAVSEAVPVVPEAGRHETLDRRNQDSLSDTTSGGSRQEGPSPLLLGLRQPDVGGGSVIQKQPSASGRENKTDCVVQ